MRIPDDLDHALRQLGARRPLLVALDFDGVLSPLVDDPTQSRPLPASVAAVERIVGADDVVVAYVSGRDLDGLRAVSAPPPGVHLVGSHGAQWQERTRDDDGGLTTEQRVLLDQVTTQLEEIVSRHPGTRVEIKPAGSVLHTRLADGDSGASATQEALDGPARLPGVKVTPGKNVVEISVTETDKGAAVQWMREHFGSAGVCFIGDDMTDETVFSTLGDSDVSVKVGPGDTSARFRVDDPAQVSAALAALASHLTE